MAFAVPRNVPSFNDAQRRNEDSIWESSRRSRFGESGVTDRIGGMFGEKKGLPMYKDKPYNYGTSNRRRPWFRRKTSFAVLLLLATGFTYWLGILPGADKGEKARARAGSSLRDLFSSEPRDKVDWNGRRERVKDAFKLSWGAYEQHGWGKWPKCIPDTSCHSWTTHVTRQNSMLIWCLSRK